MAGWFVLLRYALDSFGVSTERYQTTRLRPVQPNRQRYDWLFGELDEQADFSLSSRLKYFSLLIQNIIGTKVYVKYKKAPAL